MGNKKGLSIGGIRGELNLIERISEELGIDLGIIKRFARFKYKI